MFVLPDVLAVQHTAVRGGDLVLLGQGDNEVETLVWVGLEDVSTIPLDDAPGDSYPGASLLAHPAGGVVVVWDFKHASYVAGPEAPIVPLPIEGAELMAGVEPHPLLHWGSAVSDEATWHVVLSHGLLHGDARYAAPLSVDLTSGKARWDSAPWHLDITEFPRDLAGVEDYDPHVSISATLLHNGTVHACSAGSHIRGLYSSGADFFSCVRLAPDGHVADRVHDQYGWKQDTRKHGIDGRFTADGAYAILKPVFRSGDWKGRPRILRLSDGAILTPSLPRGRNKAEILDHHPDRGWWLRIYDTAFVLRSIFD